MICQECKNQLQKRKVFRGYIGPKCTAVYEKESYCPYCEWKGIKGPGKQLRDLVKEHNNEVSGRSIRK